MHRKRTGYLGATVAKKTQPTNRLEKRYCQLHLQILRGQLSTYLPLRQGGTRKRSNKTFRQGYSSTRRTRRSGARSDKRLAEGVGREEGPTKTGTKGTRYRPHTLSRIPGPLHQTRADCPASKKVQRSQDPIGGRKDTTIRTHQRTGRVKTKSPQGVHQFEPKEGVDKTIDIPSRSSGTLREKERR